MPQSNQFSTIVDALYNAPSIGVKAILASSSHDPLVNDKIECTDRAFLTEQADYPRMGILPIASRFEMNQPSNSAAVSGVSQGMPQLPAMQQYRMLWLEVATCELHAWGSSYDDARFLIHTFIVATHLATTFGGGYQLGAMSVNDRTPVSHRGCEFVLAFDIMLPVTDNLVALAPSDTTGASQEYIDQQGFPPAVTPGCTA